MKELKKDLKAGMSEDENYGLEKKVWPHTQITNFDASKLLFHSI